LGSTVLVTGCGSGFGGLIARTLARDGHHVFATMRDIDSRNAEPAAALREWAAEYGARIDVLELDVTSDASVQSAVDEALRRAGRIDMLINNAGVAASGPLEAFLLQQPARTLPDPQEVADAIKILVDLPPCQRPLRTVAGAVFTEGVSEYNASYERMRDHLAAVLQRPDRAITWTPAAGDPARET